MTAIDVSGAALREPGRQALSLSLPWKRLAGMARQTALVSALVLGAALPILLRMWLFLPAFHG